MAALFSNGENVTSGANLAENVIYNKEDGTRSTVKTEIDEINNNLTQFKKLSAHTFPVASITGNNTISTKVEFDEEFKNIPIVVASFENTDVWGTKTNATGVAIVVREKTKSGCWIDVYNSTSGTLTNVIVNVIAVGN